MIDGDVLVKINARGQSYCSVVVHFDHDDLESIVDDLIAHASEKLGPGTNFEIRARQRPPTIGLVYNPAADLKIPREEYAAHWEMCWYADVPMQSRCLLPNSRLPVKAAIEDGLGYGLVAMMRIPE